MSSVHSADNNGKDSLWWRITHLEPVVYRTAVVTIIALLAAFGIKVSPELSDNLVVVVVALAGLIQMVWVRGGVLPEAKVVSYLPEPVEAPADIRAGAAVTTASDDSVMDAARITGA